MQRQEALQQEAVVDTTLPRGAAEVKMEHMPESYEIAEGCEDDDDDEARESLRSGHDRCRSAPRSAAFGGRGGGSCDGTVHTAAASRTEPRRAVCQARGPRGVGLQGKRAGGI